MNTAEFEKTLDEILNRSKTVLTAKAEGWPTKESRNRGRGEEE